MTSVMMPRPVASLALRSSLRPSSFHALEIVRRGARLEGAAAQHARAGRGHAFGRLHDLLFAFHGAGAGHHDELVAADLAAVDLDGERPLRNSLLTNL